MQRQRKTMRGFIWAIALAASILSAPTGAAAETTGNRSNTRIEMQLTEDFYRALRSEGSRTYSTGSSNEYLRQIAVSTRFMVETNLQLLQQQKRIIQLLEALQAQPTKP